MKTVERGFTLLELLVVLFIAGLMTSLSVAWLDSGKASVQQALERLAAATRQQADQAVHAGQVRGLRWNGKQPEFVRLVQEQQQLRWRVERVALGDWPDNLRPDWPASPEPRLVFTPSGVSQAQRLLWRWPDGREQWRWDSAGQLHTARMP